MRVGAVGLLVTATLFFACAPEPPPGPRLPEIIREIPGSATAPRPRTDDAQPRSKPIPAEVPDGGGFGSGAMGGRGGRRILVTDDTELALRRAFVEANQGGGHATIEFNTPKYIRIQTPLPWLTEPGITIEGNGTTLDGLGMAREAALVDVRRHDIVIRNLRLRNAYDNLRIQGTSAYRVLVSHVSSTGAEDDGISISGGARDVTVEWSFLAGNTRSIFCKYLGTTNVSIHHTWIQKGWIRNALFQGPMLVDVRNVIVEDWGQWGMRFQAGATGNVVGSVFALNAGGRAAGGKTNSALRLEDTGPVYIKDTVFRGADATDGTSPEPLRVPPVATQSAAAMEPRVRREAGCQPRDRIDAAYVALPPGWTIDRRSPLRLGEPTR